MNENVAILPSEVNEIALQVPEQKQKEVQEVLTQIFTGTANWEKQINAIKVKDINDTLTINLADTARKNVKTARLAAEKLFDGKRETVKIRMTDDKLEDALWLKSKQIMQLQFKALEEKAAYEANFVKRFESEQKELQTQLRIEKISKFNPEINRIEIENLSVEVFEAMLAGSEKIYNDRIAAEKQAELDRLAVIKAKEDKQKAIEAENLKLKKDLEAKEKQRLFEAKKAEELAEKERIAANKKADTERLERERLAKIEADKQAIIESKRQAELKAEREASAKLKAKLKAKEDASFEAKQKADQLTQDKKEAERKAALAPENDKITNWIDSFDIDMIDPTNFSMNGQATVTTIYQKFKDFKDWAIIQKESLK